ncbi:MAG: nitrogenase molybdenum-iron protein alpha and beta chain-like protein [Paenibacillaceae bacterium]|jgi:hypothetical protein|nr:nitrogenase molybdenum-iron protein alpha and beta chain-like protein [Paenibacillaceae bacterium]
MTSRLPQNALRIGLPAGRSGIMSALALIPECCILFVGPAACTRHGLLAMLYAKRKYAHLCPDETDITMGTYIPLIAEAAELLVRKDGAKAIVLVTCCQNALIGTDFTMILAAIEKLGVPAAHVEINRLDMFRPANGRPVVSATMSEIAGLFWRKAALPPTAASPKAVNFLGSMSPLSPGNDVASILEAEGYSLRHVSACRDFSAFLEMSRSALNIVTETEALSAARQMESALGIPWVDMTFTLLADKVEEQYALISDRLNIPMDCRGLREQLNGKIRRLRKLIGPTPIFVEESRIPAPYAAARFLLENGFQIGGIQANRLSAREPEAKAWIQEHWPHIPLYSAPLPNQAGSSSSSGSRFGQLRHQYRHPPESYLGYTRIIMVLENLEEQYRQMRSGA